MYVYEKTEPELWTVGHYDPNGKWHPDSDQDSKEDAAKRVRYLNGGNDIDTHNQDLYNALKDSHAILLRLQEAEPKIWNNNDDVILSNNFSALQKANPNYKP